jgi:hypothetical protein
MKNEKDYVAYNEFLRANKEVTHNLLDTYFTVKGKKIEGNPALNTQCVVATMMAVEHKDRIFGFITLEKFVMPAAAASESAYIAQTLAVYGLRGWAGKVPGNLRFSLPGLEKKLAVLISEYKPKKETKTQTPKKEKQTMPGVKWNLRLGRSNNLLGDMIANNEGINNKFVITVTSTRTGTFVYRAEYVDYKSARTVFDKMNTFMKAGRTPDLKQAWVSVADLKKKLAEAVEAQIPLFTK